MLSLYEFAKKYRITFFMDSVEDSLIKHISSSNVVNLIKISSPHSFNITKLHQKCNEFFIKCLKETTPVYASESLGEKFLASLVLKSLHSNFDALRI
uniref:Uncharacterized protein n=1 Tax=Panagrolaimus sp. PS1159 TaxID=55785 RepID=A0AC35FVW1_9BILA